VIKVAFYQITILHTALKRLSPSIKAEFNQHLVVVKLHLVKYPSIVKACSDEQ
jgi:hypothetical protein